MAQSDYQYVHSVYVKANDSCCIVANVKNSETNESKLAIVPNPQVPFWITRPGLQTYNAKKEYALDSEVDGYISPAHLLPENVYKALNKRPPRGFVRFKELLDSPYIYGADIEPEVVFKRNMRMANPNFPSKYNVGGLDIETSVLGGNEINCITFVDGSRNVYCAIYKPFMRNNIVPNSKKKEWFTGDEEMLKEVVEREHHKFFDNLNDKAKKIANKKKFEMHYFISDNELDMIKWIFAAIHHHKPDFISIWNMGFDIPYIIDRIKFRGGDPAQIMSHPEVPPEWRYANFREDKSKVEHMVDRWDWLDLTGYTQFVDSMCLYGRIRKVKGREISYRLEYIASKDLGTGKLDFGQNKTHHVMQEEHFMEYVAYNLIDAIILVILDELNGDISNLVMLAGYSRLQDFSRQTVQLKNHFYNYCRENHMVPASVGTTMTTKYDHCLANVGGGVLSPTLAVGTGTPILREMPDKPTDVCKEAMDIDVSAFYPSVTIMSNVSKETKIVTVLAIEGFDPGSDIRREVIAEYGEDFKTNQALPPALRKKLDDKVYEATKQTCIETEDFFGNAVSPEVNGVYVCNKYFGLPTYLEMLALFQASHTVQNSTPVGLPYQG